MGDARTGLGCFIGPQFCARHFKRGIVGVGSVKRGGRSHICRRRFFSQHGKLLLNGLKRGQRAAELFAFARM